MCRNCDDSCESGKCLKGADSSACITCASSFFWNFNTKKCVASTKCDAFYKGSIKLRVCLIIII